MKGGGTTEPQRRASSVPAFGGWDDVAAAGAVPPDYSLDFSRVRSARRMQRRNKALSWSSGGDNNNLQRSSTAAAGGGGGSEDRERRRRHRRQHSDAAAVAEARQPIRAPPPSNKEGRSKLKGYLFGCMGRWYVGQHY